MTAICSKATVTEKKKKKTPQRDGNLIGKQRKKKKKKEIVRNQAEYTCTLRAVHQLEFMPILS